LCHLKSFQEFGRTVFPRGSMLAGHLEADKDPGRFVGKGYLKISFDRVIVPTGDLPLPAKVIQAKGYKVDKQGDIKGNGHATRDVVEWMIPPLWPWKVLTLPARGPRPTMKGEEPLQRRLMDDIVVPRTLSAAGYHPDRPPFASSSLAKPGSSVGATPANAMQPAADEKPAEVAKENIVAAAKQVNATAPLAQPAAETSPARLTMLVLKSNQILEVTRYRMDAGQVNYRELNGGSGSVAAEQIDWLRSTQMTSEVRSVDLPVMSRQTN